MQLNKDIQKTDFTQKRKIKYGFIKYRFHSYPFPKSLCLTTGSGYAAGTETKGKATDAYSVYEEIIKDNIEYDHFVRYGQVDKDRLDEIVSIILETVCSKRERQSVSPGTITRQSLSRQSL